MSMTSSMSPPEVNPNQSELNIQIDDGDDHDQKSIQAPKRVYLCFPAKITFTLMFAYIVFFIYWYFFKSGVPI